MGCAASKHNKATVNTYHPPPSSFAVFDVNAIEEPWVKVEQAPEEDSEEPIHVPVVILDELYTFEADAPHSWDEVSKAFEDLKPISDNNNKKDLNSLTFHTQEEFGANELRKTDSVRQETARETKTTESNNPDTVGFRSVKENIFIVRDREEREKEERMGNYDRLISKRDPLSEFPEICPPGGVDSVVIYTTSMRGVRRTFEDCTKIREILQVQRVVFDERDVALHAEFLNELRSLLGEEASVLRVFVKGRYVGGAEELSELNESGKLGKILSVARVERGVGRQECGGCGGARFVPCLDCGGSCKVVMRGDKKERCGKCNENGLVLCPACL